MNRCFHDNDYNTCPFMHGPRCYHGNNASLCPFMHNNLDKPRSLEQIKFEQTLTQQPEDKKDGE